MSSDLLLQGQAALVTGCARERGIGRAIALALAAAGADVCVTDLEPGAASAPGEWNGIERVAEEIRGLGRRSAALLGDVSNEDDSARMVAETIEHLGKVDILVNNAGAPHGADRNYTWEVPREAFDLVMQVNIYGPFLMSRAVIPHLIDRGEGGRIINIASLAGRLGVPKRGAYCASKFALIGLTQVMALELASHHVTVNAICPGTMDTDRNASRAQAVADDPSLAHLMTPPVGRLGLPADVARTAVFLADPASDFVTAQSINIDGGSRPS